MASPVVTSKVGGARKVKKNKGRNNKKGVKGEEGSRFWMKLKFSLSCMPLGSKAKSSKRGKNKQDGHLTSKSDVYSFVEVLTGRRAMGKRNNEEFYQLIDPRLEGQYSPRGAYKEMRWIGVTKKNQVSECWGKDQLYWWRNWLNSIHILARAF